MGSTLKYFGTKRYPELAWHCKIENKEAVLPVYGGSAELAGHEPIAVDSAAVFKEQLEVDVANDPER
jgi:hypothetical protein